MSENKKVRKKILDGISGLQGVCEFFYSVWNARKSNAFSAVSESDHQVKDKQFCLPLQVSHYIPCFVLFLALLSFHRIVSDSMEVHMYLVFFETVVAVTTKPANMLNNYLKDNVFIHLYRCANFNTEKVFTKIKLLD